ncbi:MAG: prepilin-type N-terminal cleavage/methylation domain-containing protein [Candidatus Acidiferrales bacterium]
MIKKQKGFSLIELLIVVAIILIIAAIAIPNLLRSRMAANEASAVGSVRTINTAAVTWSSEYNAGFPNSLAALGGPVGAAATCTTAELIDPVLAAGAKSGYTLALANAGGTAVTVGACTGSTVYQITAVPTSPGQTGQRGFYSDESGVIRFTTDGSAPTIGSPALQ